MLCLFATLTLCSLHPGEKKRIALGTSKKRRLVKGTKEIHTRILDAEIIDEDSKDEGIIIFDGNGL